MNLIDQREHLIAGGVAPVGILADSIVVRGNPLPANAAECDERAD